MSVYLVLVVVTVEQGDQLTYVARGCRCRSQFCDRCRMQNCIKYRERLRPAIKQWSCVLMLTFTLDRKLHIDGEAAYRHVQGKRLIAELMRKLDRLQLVKSRRFVYVIEFHKDGGWPHWHVLVESRYICKHKLQAMWGQGHVWVSRQRRFTSANHAVHYVTKYLAKVDHPYPDWVLDYKGNFRRFSCSRGLLGWSSRRVKDVDPDEPVVTRKRITIRERVADCESRTDLLTVDVAGQWRWAARLDVPPGFFEGLDNGELKLIAEAVADWGQLSQDGRRKRCRSDLATSLRREAKTNRRLPCLRHVHVHRRVASRTGPPQDDDRQKPTPHWWDHLSVTGSPPFLIRDSNGRPLLEDEAAKVRSENWQSHRPSGVAIV